MDIRDFVQAVSGALILRPDNILVASALTEGAGVSKYFGGAKPGDPLVGAISLAHVFLLTGGLGLLLGIGLSSSVAIGFFVVIGVAGGLFAIDSVINILGPQFSGAAANVQASLASLVVQPYIADAYLFIPFVVFAGGLYRWDHTTKVRKMRAIQAAQLSMRQYCTYCGARHEPTASRCEACGKGVAISSGSFCTECGKPNPREAGFCGFCGAEVVRGDATTCPECRTAASEDARYCFSCGARLRSKAPANDGSGPSET